MQHIIKLVAIDLNSDLQYIYLLAFRKLLGVSSDAEICIMEYLKPFTIADEFSYVTDQITKLLHLDDPNILVEGCKTVMASDDVYGIKFFSDDQIEQLYCHHNTPLLLQELSYLWSWSNHSVLRILVGACDEAIKLLDVFDSHLDPFEPIASYPVFESVPTDATAQTTLIVKFTRDVQEFTLQVVFDLCSIVVSNCGITHYCPQLIATQHTQGSYTIYWSIPKCVINIISSKVLQHSSKLNDMGMLEVTIYPDTKIITGDVANLNVSLK